MDFLAQSADIYTYGLTSAAAAGPVGVLLMIAVIYFAKRDAKREDREREDKTLLTTALAQNTAALLEVRREMERSTKLREDTRRSLDQTVKVLEKLE